MRRSIAVDSSNNMLCCCFKRSHGMEKQHKTAAAVAVESAEPPPLVPGLESLHSQHFVHFKTRNLIYKQLLEALERNYMTGLHGIEGIGKTTIAKQACLKLHESIKFDHVIFITVSKCSNIKEIQDIIAAKLGLSLEGNNEWERIETIMKGLMNGERIMLILDDVREYINTEELGIPSIPNNMNCRVLVTSRNKEVCMSLGCRRSIQVDKLSMKESWMSFKKHAGINDNSSEEEQHLGKQIIEECEGLPIIVAIASILKGRSLEEWKQTLGDLKRYYYYDECLIKAYAFLNFRNDDLNIEKAQRLSILLSMSLENREVPIEMLTRLSIGVGLFCEVEKYSDARSEVLKLKDILKASHVCFEDEEGHIKLNDSVWERIHDYGLSMCKFTYDYNFKKWVLSIIEENINYLYYSDLLVEEMETDIVHSWRGYDRTKVEMLLINVKASNSVEVPDAFFEKMTRLQVLSLASNNLHLKLALKLPSSLQSLTNIRSLLLSHWKLHDISILGKLQSLDTLDFDDCSIYEFPKEISTLLKLRLLSLKRCQIVMNNPFEVIERCLWLQELYYKDNEVSNLHSVNEAEEIYQSETFHGLNRYHLQGGEDDLISKCVCLPSIDALVSEATFKYLIQGAEILHLKEIKGKWRNLIPDIVSGMNDLVELCVESCLHLQGILFKSKVNLCNLKSVNLFRCQELTYLFQLSTARSLVPLEELRVRECKLLTGIIEDENDRKSNGLTFPKLETLEIEDCERLECILPVDVMHLQNIKISKCPKLKDKFYEEPGVVKKSRLQKVELSDVSHLFNISIECHHLLASRLKRSSPRADFKAKQHDPSKFLISQGSNTLVVHNIKQLVLKDLDKIKYLFTLSTASSMMLEILIVDSCDVLKHIVDIGDDRDGKNFDVFQKLEELSVFSCGQLESMFGVYHHLDDKNYNEIPIHLPALKKLNLQKLPKFSPISMTWTYLKEFVLIQCSDFIINPISDMMIHFHSRKLVTTTIEDIRVTDKHFLTLETLNIEGYEAESVFCVSGVEIIGQVRLGLQCLKLSDLPRMLNICVGFRSSFFFQNLKTIQIVGCAKLKVIFPASVFSYLPELEVLEIQNCQELKEIIKKNTQLGNVDYPQSCFPKLAKLMVIRCVRLKSLIPTSDIPNVKTIRVENCFNLEILFPSSVLRCLPELEDLEIQDCFILEKIIEKEDKKLGNVDSPHPCFPKLEVLKVKECNYLKHLIHASDVPNVKKIRIENCSELEVIFSDSVLRCLSELEVLEIQKCYHLKQIIDDDKKLGNVDSPQPCFPKLRVLFVNYCMDLTRLFSASNDVPNLELLIIINSYGLEELMGGGEQKQGDDVSIGKIKVELPKLKLLIFGGLHNTTFKEENELQTVCHRFVYKCPKLSLKSTSTFKEMEEKVRELFQIDLKTLLDKEDYEDMIQSDSDSSQSNEESENEDMLQGDEIVSGSDLDSSESEFELSKSETHTDKENKGHPTNIQDLKENDLIISSQHVEVDGQIPTPSVSVITVEHSATNGNSVVKTLTDLEKYLKMPLMDLASSKANSHCLLRALHFLSHLPSEDKTVSHELKATIDSLHQEFLSILRSLKQEFATNNNFAVLEETEKSIEEELARLSGVATTLDSKISKAENFIDEAQKKEAILKKQTISLETERKESHELEDGRSMSESCLMNQQNPLGEIEITTEIPQSEIGLKQGLIDFEESLKMPLKDIANSEANSHRLLTALNFFSHLHLDPLHQEYPSILSSFKQVFATIKKIALLEPNMNEVATMLVSKISKAETYMGEAQQKEATLKEYIIRLDKATTDLPIGLEAQTMSGNDLPSSEVSINHSMHANLAGYKHNDSGIKLDDMSIASPNLTEINEESKKEFVGKAPDSEIPATATSPTDLKPIETLTSIPLDNSICKTDLHELVDGQSMSESCLMNQQKPIGENESTIEIPQCAQKTEDQSIQAGFKSEKTVTTVSTYSETRSTSLGSLLDSSQMSIHSGIEEETRSVKIVASATHSESANSQSHPHREIKHSQIDITGDDDSEARSINIQDIGDKDLVKSFSLVEEDGDSQIHTTSVSDVVADNLVKLLTDLKKILKMPLKDIAFTKGNSGRLLTALNLLSNSTLEDATLSDGLKAIIVSMHKEPESILCSFRQVFAFVNNFVELQPYLNKVATVKEQINRLQSEIKDCEAKLSSLQEEKKKCIAETKRCKEENYNVKKEKSKMLEDQRKAEEVLLKVHYGWSDLCSQFELNLIAAI